MLQQFPQFYTVFSWCSFFFFFFCCDIVIFNSLFLSLIQAAHENDRDRILGPHKRILKWVEDVKSATAPHFEEIHALVYSAREPLKKLKAQAVHKKE